MAEARLEGRILLAAALTADYAWLLAHAQDDLPCDSGWQQAQEGLSRRLAGEPMAYILGEREFYGLPLAVSPAVLIPRPDTEVLVDAALDYLNPTQAACVLDLGTGSGAIALAIVAHRPLVQVVAVDASLPALQQAQGNAQRLGLQAQLDFRCGSWWQAVADQQFDLVVSNPPYIAANDEHLAQGDLRFEPRQALAAGADGLDDIRQIVSGASAHLQAGAWLILEHGYDQGAAVRVLMRDAGLCDIHTRLDLAGHERVTGGRCRTAQSTGSAD